MTRSAPIHILLIEDNATDVLLFKEALAELTEFKHVLFEAVRLADGIDSLGHNLANIVLLDLGLPDSQGLATFESLHRKVPDIPVVVLTALDDESMGGKAIKLGAQDYLMKNQLQPALLERSIRYAIDRQNAGLELLKSQQQFRALAARLQDVREAERTHIAREVHDELGQGLTAVKMDLRWVERRLANSTQGLEIEPMRERVVEAQKLADRMIETMQRISLELRPSALDHLGLTEAIRDESRRFSVRTGIQITLDLPADLRPLKIEIVTACFRIFQELLTNVIRHAAANQVKVSLVANEDGLELLVEDDGKGITAEALTKPTSLGLLGMSERAISLSGRISFEGVPGKGTRATLRVPLESQ